MVETPRLEYRTIVNSSGNPGYVNRMMVGTACTGLVRIEWLQARMGAVAPVNWSWVQMYQYINGFYTLDYQVADAQNVIVKAAIDGDFQWLLLWEHDVIPQPDVLIRLNEYISKATHPVVSGLYFTRSIPSEPLIFRGTGTGAFYDWKMGDKVYCDGVPTGMLLIHVGLLREMWKDSEEYTIGNTTTRRLFVTPRGMWWEPSSGMWNTVTGTSDLDWCKRVIEGDYLRKSGWGSYVDSLEDKSYPFLVDTGIFCRHINPDGQVFP